MIFVPPVSSRAIHACTPAVQRWSRSFSTAATAADVKVKDMFLRYTHPGIRSAGMLPFMLSLSSPERVGVYVLLSQEGTRKDRSSGLWRGFGGAMNPGETPVEAAIRETCEESLGLLRYSRYFNEKYTAFDPRWWHLSLGIEHTRRGFLQLMVPIRQSPEASPADLLPERFQEGCKTASSPLEKVKLQWVLYSDLLREIQRASQLSIEKRCRPMHLQETFSIKGMGILDPSFVETMVIGAQSMHPYFLKPVNMALEMAQSYEALQDPVAITLLSDDPDFKDTVDRTQFYKEWMAGWGK